MSVDKVKTDMAVGKFKIASVVDGHPSNHCLPWYRRERTADVYAPGFKATISYNMANMSTDRMHHDFKAIECNYGNMPDEVIKYHLEQRTPYLCVWDDDLQKSRTTYKPRM